MRLKRSNPDAPPVPPGRSAAMPPHVATTDAVASLAEVDAAWTREAVTLRLTAERKRKLRALFDDREDKLSPTGALDLAIERAFGAGNLEQDDDDQRSQERELLPLVDELRSAIQVFASASEDWADIRAQLAHVSADCAELRSAISSAAMLRDVLPVNEQGAPIPLKSWLGRQPDPGRAWLLAKAKWIAKKSAGFASKTATWEFEIQLFDGSGVSKQRQPSPTTVYVGSASSHALHALHSRIELGEELILVCSRSGEGWAISARAILDGAKVGEVLATFTLE